MKVAYKYLQGLLDFDKSNVQVLVIENKHLLRKTVHSLNKNNGIDMFTFSEKFEPIDPSKKVLFIPDPISAVSQDKKIISKMSTELSSILNDNYYQELQNIITEIYEICQALCSDTEFDFDYHSEPDASSIIKLMDFRPNFSDEITDLERLWRVIKLSQKYLNLSCFVICNFNFYFTRDEAFDFYKNARYENILLILIEGIVPEPTGNEIISVIDSDLCQIVDNTPL